MRHDLTEFFGVVATFHDDAHSHSFEISRDGLRLLVRLFDLEGAVYVCIFRDGLQQNSSRNCIHPPAATRKQWMVPRSVLTYRQPLATASPCARPTTGADQSNLPVAVSKAET